MGTIHWLRWKKSTCKSCSTVAKFKINLFKTNTAPQSCEIFKMFVWWGHKLAPQNTIICKFVQLCTAIIKLSLFIKDVSLSNLVSLLILRCSFQWIFSSKVQKRWKGLLFNDISIGNNKLMAYQLSVIPVVVVQAFSLAVHVVA